MKHLWQYIDKKAWNAGTKYRITLMILGIPLAIAGLLAWLLIRSLALSTWDWMICFTAYPVVISWFAAFLYSCNHEYHNGTFH